MDISNLTNLITAFRAESRQNTISPDTLGNLLQKIVNVIGNIDTSSNSSGSSSGNSSGTTSSQCTNPFYHIECDSSGSSLKVKWPADLILKGYVPYLLRWSMKRQHQRDRNDHTRRWHGPRCRGWHLFGDGNRIRMDLVGTVQFGWNFGTDRNPDWRYAEQIDYLFKRVRAVYTGANESLQFKGYKVCFGSKQYLIKHNHRFRFGIIFGPPLNTYGDRSLDFSKCVTNIAEFYVNLSVDAEELENESYRLSYSI